jgi:hypothetical protein
MRDGARAMSDGARWRVEQLAEWREQAELAWAALPAERQQAKSRRHWVPAYMGYLASLSDGHALPAQARTRVVPAPAAAAASAPPGPASSEPSSSSVAAASSGPSRPAADPGRAARLYVRARRARLGAPLPHDARVWLTEAGRIVATLASLHQEEQAVRGVLTDGSGASRKARERARTAVRQLKRRAMRLRASLAHCERRLEELAGWTSQGDLATRFAAHHREAGRA